MFYKMIWYFVELYLSDSIFNSIRNKLLIIKKFSMSLLLIFKISLLTVVLWIKVDNNVSRGTYNTFKLTR